jgi:hypothetical protein
VQRHNKFEAFLFHSIHNILSSSLSLNPEIWICLSFAMGAKIGRSPYAMNNVQSRTSDITLKSSNNAALRPMLLFIWTWPIVEYYTTQTLRFGSCLCSLLQVKKPVLLGLIIP